MRGSGFALLCLLMAGPAAAQERGGATRSVADYLCAFAGKCGDAGEAAEPTRNAPKTKGFRLARPAGDKASPAPRTAVSTAQRQRQAATTNSRGRASASRSASVGARRSRRSSAALASALAPPAFAQPGLSSSVAERRADLRLSFEMGSDRLTPQALDEARVFAQSLMLPELAGKRFLIEGHTDAVGGRTYNLDLSRRRARAVADHLAGLGVARDRLDVRGFGFDRPLARRRSASPLNRRVEAVLVS